MVGDVELSATCTKCGQLIDIKKSLVTEKLISDATTELKCVFLTFLESICDCPGRGYVWKNDLSVIINAQLLLLFRE
jgi:hypothetical protein